MDYWFETEIRARRDDALASAIRSRHARLAESGRSRGVRARIADGAQALSDRLARLALAVRGTEHA
jgi:hypothetical protein